MINTDKEIYDAFGMKRHIMLLYDEAMLNGKMSPVLKRIIEKDTDGIVSLKYMIFWRHYYYKRYPRPEKPNKNIREFMWNHYFSKGIVVDSKTWVEKNILTKNPDTYWVLPARYVTKELECLKKWLSMPEAMK